MIGETTTLRDSARRLARAKNPKAKGIQSTALFNLLRAGKLRAGFYMLEGSAWVEIPINYWEGLALKRFGKIARNPNDPKSGSFRLRGDQFPDQIAKIVSDRIQAGSRDPRTALAEISAVIAGAGKLIEVTIKEISDFLQTRGLREQVSPSKAGRRRKEGWRELCSYMAAYMVAHFRDLPGVELKITEVGQAIYEVARADGVPGLPDGKSIIEYVSKAMALLKEPSFSLKK
jgi:hypothetical protein